MTANRKRMIVRIFAAFAVLVLSSAPRASADVPPLLACFDDWTLDQCEAAATNSCVNQMCDGDPALCSWEGECYFSAASWSYCTSSNCHYYDQ